MRDTDDDRHGTEQRINEERESDPFRPKPTSRSYRIGFAIGRARSKTRATAEELQEYIQEELANRREDRHDDLLLETTWRILAKPEFSHSVEVHGSSKHVINYVTERKDEIIEGWSGRYERVRSATRNTAIGAALTVAILVSIIGELVSRWIGNDARNDNTFPSTQWFQTTTEPLGWPGIASIAAVATVAFIAMVVGAIKEVFNQLNKFLRTRRGVEEAVIPYVRLALNEWSDRVSPTELRFEEAPALSSTTDSRYLIERPELARIKSLIRELGASAVAISGPRGAGKSTLLRSLAKPSDDKADLFIALEAPSSYEPREFIITLYRQLCECIQQNVSAMADRRHKRFLYYTLTALRFLAILGVLAILASQWEPARRAIQLYLDPQVIPSSGWQALALITALLVLFALLGVVRPDRGRPGADTLAQRASAEAERLQFLQSIATERSSGIKAKFGFELGAKRSRQLLEQSAALPDLVRSYRQLAADAIEWWRSIHFSNGGNLIIVIDELDRVTDVESAERFINHVKGIFGIEGCTYLVTVSEDALAQFERRMVGIRPVLDSTFDEVVRLPVLDLAQSREVLARRLVGFPQAFIALCHALSGGIPRDLIRAARSLIDSRRTVGRDDIVPLAHEIVHQEIMRLKSGLIGRVNADVTGSEAHSLLRLLADSEWPPRDSDYLIDTAEQLASPLDDERKVSSRVAVQLGVALYYYGTILQVLQDLESGHIGITDLAGPADKLAVARSVMPTSVELAYVHLQKLRSDLHFQ